MGPTHEKPRFDCRRALDALKHTSIQCPRVTVEFIQKMAGWYVDFLSNKPQPEPRSPLLN